MLSSTVRPAQNTDHADASIPYRSPYLGRELCRDRHVALAGAPRLPAARREPAPRWGLLPLDVKRDSSSKRGRSERVAFVVLEANRRNERGDAQRENNRERHRGPVRERKVLVRWNAVIDAVYTTAAFACVFSIENERRAPERLHDDARQRQCRGDPGSKRGRVA